LFLAFFFVFLFYYIVKQDLICRDIQFRVNNIFVVDRRLVVIDRLWRFWNTWNVLIDTLELFFENFCLH
jgi:hypothetical protein